MSWYLKVAGGVGKVREAIDNHSKTLTGKNKDEFDAAKPHILALIDMNKPFGVNQVGISFTGNGSANWNGDTVTSGNCNVKIEPIESFIG